MNTRSHGLVAAALSLVFAATAVRAQESVVGLVRAADQALASNDFAAARASADRATALDPAYAPAWRFAALARVRAGDAADAIAAYDRAILLAPDDPVLRRELALAHWQAGNTNAALRALVEHLRRQPEDISANRELGRWLSRADKPEDAALVYERLVRLRPDDPAVWRERGSLLLRLGRREEALASLTKAITLDPADAPSHRDLGWALWAAGRREEGLRALRQALVLNVADSETVMLQVVARLAEEDDAAAAIVLRRELRPGAPLLPFGVELLHRGRVRAAEPFLAAAWRAQEPDAALYLAYARAANGRCDAVAELLAGVPFEQLNDTLAELLIETLALCGSAAAAPDVLARVDQAWARRPALSARMTEILERAADEWRFRGDDAAALRLYRRALERDPDRTAWVWALPLVSRLEGVAAAHAYAEALAARARQPATRDALAGWLADQRGDPAAAVRLLRSAIAAGLDAPPLRQLLFDNLLQEGQIEAARAEAQHMADRVEAGDGLLRSYVAEMWTRLGEHEAALILWQMLRLSRPDLPYYGIASAQALLMLGRPDEALDLLSVQVANHPHAPTYEMLAEIETALGRPIGAAQWAAEGLARAPSDNLRRYYAENLEAVGTNNAAALAVARAYFDTDPGYEPMALAIGRLLTADKQGAAAIAHYRALLDTSPVYAPGRVGLRERLSSAGAEQDALNEAEKLVAIRPGDADVQRRLAISLAEADRFPRAIETLEPLAGMPLTAATPILVYDNPTLWPYAGRIRVSQITEHLERLADAGYRFVRAWDELEQPQPPSNRVLVVILNGSSAALAAIEPTLRRLAAHAFYAAHAGILAGREPGYPAADDLRARSNLWTVISAGPAPRPRAPLPGAVSSSVRWRGNPWTHRLARGADAAENDEEVRQRLTRAFAAAAATLPPGSPRVLLHPRGDDGFRSLLASPLEVRLYREAVAAQFTHGLRYDDAGYTTPLGEPLALPARLVPPDWDGGRLLDHLKTQHPLVAARLDLAKVLYWNRQHELADRWFGEALAAGADPVDTLLHRGANATLWGDLKLAIASLEEARRLAPDDDRVARALDRARNVRRLEIALTVGGWEDNEDRSWQFWRLDGDLPLGQSLRLRAELEHNRWARDGFGDESGVRLGLGGQWRVDEGAWVEGRVWHMDFDQVRDRWGGDALAHFSNPLWSGYLEPFYARREEETVEAVRAGIFGDLYGVRSYSRLADVVDVFLNAHGLDRTDDNELWQVETRILYRIREWPHLAAGYRGRWSDARFDPPEYWAPERLEQHQLDVTARTTWRALRLFASGQAGYAHERDTDWRFVWSARAGGDLGWSARGGLRGEWSYFEGPVYERTTWNLGLYGRF